jgi:hypothetical protein
MEELNERLAIREERIATRKAAMNGNIRPRINQFKRGAEGRTFLTPLALNTIQSYLPGHKLDYFRKPENRLSIFRIRSGLIDVLKELNITTFTREEVFMVIRANNIAGLRYMLEVHPTMIQDHATTYLEGSMRRTLRRNEPAEVLEHMHRLDPTMFEDADSVLYSYLLFGYNYTEPRSHRNFINTFIVINRHIMIPRSLLSQMTQMDFSLTDNDISSVIEAVITHNPQELVRFVPTTLDELLDVYPLLVGFHFDAFWRRDGASARLRDLLNTHVLPDYIFPLLIRQHYLNVNNLFFNALNPESNDTWLFFLALFAELQYDHAGVVVGIGNPARINAAINEIPRELNQMTRHLIPYANSVDVRQRLTDHADDGDDILSGPDATRPGSRSSSGAQFSRAPSSAAASSSAGFFSASPSSAAASSSAGFVSASPSDAGFFLFSYA